MRKKFSIHSFAMGDIKIDDGLKKSEVKGPILLWRQQVCIEFDENWEEKAAGQCKGLCTRNGSLLKCISSKGIGIEK